MVIIDQGLCHLLRSVTGLKGRTDEGSKIHPQIMVASWAR
jgi:hypothetical protein